MAATLDLFGQRLRSLRADRSWTQEALAERAGLHENFISRLETGDQEPGLFVILKLCRAFEITPRKLLDTFTLSTITQLRLR